MRLRILLVVIIILTMVSIVLADPEIYQRRPNDFDDSAGDICTDEINAYDYDNVYAHCDPEDGDDTSCYFWNSTSQSPLGNINSATFGIEWNCTGTLANDYYWIEYGFTSTPGDCTGVSVWYNISDYNARACPFAFTWDNATNETPVTWTDINNTCWRFRQERNAGPDGTEVYIDAFHVDVDYTANTPPTWSNNNSDTPTTYSPTTNSEFNISWTDPETSISVVFLEGNWSACQNNCTMTNSYGGDIYNYTAVLPAGTWYWKSYANDTENAWNTSDTWYFTINKLTSNASLTIPEGNGTYPHQTTTTCTEDNPEASGGLYRNDSDASAENDTAITLPADTWEYICNVSSTQNYSLASNSSILIISQNTSTLQYLNLTINDTESNKQYQYPSGSNVTTWNKVPELTFTMYLNYTADSSDNDTVIVKGGGLYVYEYNTSGNPNYSSASKQYNLTITKAPTNISLWLNDSEDNVTYNINEVANFTAKINISTIDVSLVSNYTGWVIQTATEVIYNYTTLATGGDWWNITANFSGNENYTSFQRTYFFNVTDNPPSWLANDTSVTNNSEYRPGRNYGFQINWTDDVSVSEVLFEWGGSNYSYLEGEVSKTGTDTYYYNITDLSAGSWIYTWYANDSGDQWTQSDSWTYAVQKNQTNPVDLYLNSTPNDNKTYTYPEAINATGANTYPNSGTALLWRNGSSKANPEEILLGNDTYLYKVNTSGNINYTVNDTGAEFYAFVNKGDPSNYLKLALNGTEDNQTFTYPVVSNATGWWTWNNEDLTFTILRNDSVKDTGNPANEIIQLGADYYNYTYNMSGGTNWSSGFITRYLNITQNTSTQDYMNLTINDTESNKEYQYANSSNVTAWNSLSELTFNLYRNDSDGTSDNNTVIAKAAGLYMYEYNTSGNPNYSSASKQYNLTITKAVPELHVAVNGSETHQEYMYPYPTNTTGWETNSEDEGCSYNLYRDHVPKTNPEEILLGGGNYTYIYNTSGCTNYSSGSLTRLLNITQSPTNITLWLNDSEDNVTYNQYEVANFTAQINVTGLDVSLVSNFSGWVIQTDTTTIYNYTNLTVAGNWWNITANSSGNQNYSAFMRTYFFNVTSLNIPPKWYDNNTNPDSPTTYAPGKSYQFNITWNDTETFVDEVILEFNYNNYSYKKGELSIDGEIYYKTFTDLAANESGYDYKWYANDSDAAWNSTGNYWSYIINKNSSGVMRLWLNDSEDNASYVQYEVANFTARLNLSSRTINLTSNYTGFAEITNSTSVIYNFTTLSTAGDWWNLTAYWIGDENYSSGLQTHFFNVTPDQYPEWSDNQTSVLNNSQYAPGRNYGFQINWTDDVSVSEVLFEWGGSNYSYLEGEISNSEDTYWYNLTDLPVGSWDYKWYANDTVNQWNNTSTLVYAVSENTSTPNYLNLTINDTESNKSYQYPNGSNVTAWNKIPQLTFTMYLNWSADSSDNNTVIVKGGGLYVYEYNTSGNPNYSSASKQYNLTINPAPTSIKLYKNGTEWTSDYEAQYPEGTDVNATINVSSIQASVTLYRNDTDYGNPEVVLLGVEYYNYTGYFAGNENYSSSSNTRFLNITQADNPVNMYLNGTENDNKTYTYPESVNATGASAGGTASLYRNLSSVSNPEEILLGNGTHNYTVNATGNTNYSDNTTGLTYWAFVNKGIPNTFLTISPGNTTYPTQTTTVCTEDNPETSGGLYRNDSDASAENDTAITLPADTWEYICNVSSTENYSFAMNSSILIISQNTSTQDYMNLTLNGTEANRTYKYPSAINATAWHKIPELTFNMYRNDTPKNNETIVLGVEYHQYVYNTSGNPNYSSAEKIFYFNQTKGPTDVSLWLNDSEDNVTYAVNEIANFTAKVNISGLTINLTTNISGWEEIENTTVIYNTTNMSTEDFYNITAYFIGTANYSASSRTHFATVQGAYLEVGLIEPTGTLLVLEGDTFVINSSITCRNANCGNINVTSRYNDDPIPEGSGSLYVVTQLQNCTLNKDETCYRDWTVYTTNIGTWDIDVNATPLDNDTTDVTVSVYRIIREVGRGALPSVGGIKYVEGLTPLLDLEIVNLTPKVFAGDDIIFTINLTNVGNITTFDVVMHKRIKDYSRILVEDVVTRSMTSGLLVTDTLNVPKDFDADRYFFEVYVEYVGKNASALMVFYVLKDCLTMEGASYDIMNDRFVIYTDDLRNTTLKFHNKCDFKLTDTTLLMDGGRVDIGTVPVEGFETIIDFNRYGFFNATIEYNEGYSIIEFYLDSIAVSDLTALLISIVIIVIIIIAAIYLLRRYQDIIREKIIEMKRPVYKPYRPPEEFGEKLKEEVIKKLEERYQVKEEIPPEKVKVVVEDERG